MLLLECAGWKSGKAWMKAVSWLGPTDIKVERSAGWEGRDSSGDRPDEHSYNPKLTTDDAILGLTG